MIAFRLKSDMHDAARVMARELKTIHYAFSLGHQRSIIVHLDTAEMNATFQLDGTQLEDYRAFAGDGIFRLSIGLEAAEDLIADLDQALRAPA